MPGIFNPDTDKQFFLDHLREIQKKYGDDVEHFVVRDKCVHFASSSRRVAEEDGKKRFGSEYIICTIQPPQEDTGVF